MIDVLKYIHDNIDKPLLLAEVAEKFGYSKYYFCTRFHEFTGKSFVKYVRHYRIQLAAFEILEGKKISDIALSCGYESISGFNKAFLAEYGCMPGEFKKQAREAQLYYERRKLTMYPLTNRCTVLRERAVEAHDFEECYGAQANVYTVIGKAKAVKNNLSGEEIIAEGIAYTVEKFTPVILPDELIVGFNYGDSVLDEYFYPENTEEHREIMRKNGISASDTELYFESKPISDGALLFVQPDITQREAESTREWAAIGRCIDSNHTVLGYETVLKLGFDGIYKKIEEYELKNGKSGFYTALKRIASAACKIGEKYVSEAKRLKAENDGRYNTEDLDSIIEVCSNVPLKPAKSFKEAIQSIWFAHILNTWEDHINANSIGRLDQILYPYYKNDIDKGIITKAEAFEIVCCLWIKLYRDYDVQQSCVGGTDSNGKSTVNELSYMMLDATEQLDFVRCLSVRYGKNTEKEFICRALEVVGHVQKGIPFFFNDDVMVPALMSKGISEADAYGYTQIGCVETVIPGKSNPHAVTGETNLLKALEYVFCNGFSMMYPELETGLKTGELESFTSYKKFYAAVLEQIDGILDITCSLVKKYRDSAANTSKKPYKSLLTEGCIESGRDFNDAGALYDYYQIMLGGIPNLADSLEVIKKYVYEEHKYTLSSLKNILENDYPDEAVRQEFINKVAKYGNDIDSVDLTAADIINHSCDTLEALSEKYGISFHAQPFTYLWMIEHGRESAASPDGRKKGEVIAYSLSPMQGRDFNGLTALLNSIAKLPTKRTPGTVSAIVEVDPKLFTDRNIGTLCDIFLSASANGLCNVQFNTVDADTLINAKAHPEKYNNLAVRVSGFSQKFNLLSPELQDHIIGRTKHACL